MGLPSDKSRASTGVSDNKSTTLKRSATASSFVSTGVSAPPTGKRGRTAVDYGDNGNASAEQTNTTSSEYGKKVVPVLLPNNWHFLHDLTMPEAPIVGFETSIVSLVCMHLLPRCAQSVRTYLTDRIITATRESLMDTASALRDLASDSSVMDETGRVSVTTARESFAAGKTGKACRRAGIDRRQIDASDIGAADFEQQRLFQHQRAVAGGGGGAVVHPVLGKGHFGLPAALVGGVHHTVS